MRVQLSRVNVWSLLIISSLAYFLFANEVDNDLWGHVLFGKYVVSLEGLPHSDPFAYTTAGLNWIMHEWLSQVILFLLWDSGGNPALLWFKFLISFATFMCCFSLIKRRVVWPPLQALIAILFIAVVSRGFAPRPQLFTYFGVALLLYLYERQKSGVRWALPLIVPYMWIWSNAHAGFVAGIGTLAVLAFFSLVTRSADRNQTLVIFIVASCVALINPMGISLFQYIVTELSTHHPITEWQPVSFTRDQLPFLLMVGLAGLTFPFNRYLKERPWEVLLMIGSAVMAFEHQRHTPLFAVLAVAPLAGQLQGAKEWLDRRGMTLKLSGFSRAVLAVSLLGLTGVQLYFTVARFYRDRFDLTYLPSDYPTRIANGLSRLPKGVKVNVATPLEWGEFLMGEVTSHVRVSFDGRFATLFSEALIEQHFELFYGTNASSPILDNFSTDAVIVPHGGLCRPCENENWQVMFSDPIATLYVRKKSEFSTSIAQAFSQPIRSSAGIFGIEESGLEIPEKASKTFSGSILSMSRVTSSHESIRIQTCRRVPLPQLSQRDQL